MLSIRACSLSIPGSAFVESNASTDFGYEYRGKALGPGFIQIEVRHCINYEDGEWLIRSFTRDANGAIYARTVWENPIYLEFHVYEGVIGVTIYRYEWPVQSCPDVFLLEFRLYLSLQFLPKLPIPLKGSMSDGAPRHPP